MNSIEVTTQQKLDHILRHITDVRDSCLLLGKRLIENGEEDVGRKLIANGLIHDNSKLLGIEWLYLNEETKTSEPDKFKLALEQHLTTNPHHPEYWPGGIEEMEDVYLAEMCCDWKARSSEFGRDLFDWIKYKATKKYKFSVHGTVYKDIKRFADMLLSKTF